MHVGHFAVGFVAKSVDTKLSLGTLVFAAMLVDFLWCIFMLAGIDHVGFKPGKGAANYLVAFDISWSHSLVTTAIWAALLAGAYFLWKRYSRGALLIFLVALSHWPLDVLAHPPDMTIAPGIHRHLGLGLWTNVLATVVVEGGLWLLAIILYLRVTRSRKWLGTIVFWVGIILLTLIGYNNVAGPPPPNPSIVPITSLIYFSLVIGWAYWVNKLRSATGLREPLNS